MSIKQGEHERGIPICGTGIGMRVLWPIKSRGPRRTVSSIPSPPSEARKSNNAQIITPWRAGDWR
ncbi:hypothetical protein LNP74_24235 [Klebsiella pneumoniae subsp. pneumoniae]|nr:hypothetical protein [Klebsiella pneumoniae subsp. pneumoniae]